ncbi:MAG: response regulator [Caulobacterales bacterium]|nr:response regulator [Caulobacterales bacterium]
MSAKTECPEQRDQLTRMVSAGRRLGDLVNAMLSEGEGSETQASSKIAGPTPVLASGEEVAPLRILCADDHENNRLVVTTMLRAMGWSCDTANDGAEAVERVRAGDYDLVLMDVQMPVMDGVDATKAIRSLNGAAGRTPIVALTANTLETQLRRYRAAGMQDCLAKPIGMAELMQTVVAWTAPRQDGTESDAVLSA